MSTYLYGAFDCMLLKRTRHDNNITFTSRWYHKHWFWSTYFLGLAFYFLAKLNTSYMIFTIKRTLKSEAEIQIRDSWLFSPFLNFYEKKLYQNIVTHCSLDLVSLLPFKQCFQWWQHFSSKSFIIIYFGPYLWWWLVIKGTKKGHKLVYQWLICKKKTNK